jgi:hypothetical protein
MARKSDLLVYVQLSGSEDVDRARRRVFAAGLNATRLQIDQGDLSHLQLANKVADVLIAVGGASKLSEAEVLRVLRPQGRALFDQRELVKPVPDGMDDWSHPYHGPDNNPLSEDHLIRAPYLTQFLLTRAMVLRRSWPLPPVAACSRPSDMLPGTNARSLS